MALLDRLALGDHICWTVGDDAVRLDSLAGLVGAGFSEGHRVLYCGDDSGAVVAAVERRGGSGDLRILPVESSYLTRGVFDPVSALSFLRREVEDARRAGCEGLRLITDMSWARRPTPGADRLPSFEAEANTIFAEGFVLGVCAYDYRVFDAPRLRDIARAHPGIVGDDVPFDPALVLRMRRTERPFGLRLEGEVDLSNAPALSAVIDHLLGIRPDREATVTVDVEGLSFVDTAAARVLLGAWERAEGRLRLVGRSPAFDRILEVHGAGRIVGVR
ncbi:MEDS domain-containing protein [Nucisporomicrobium flavum]|uniref:MEDS domain-containing protein n=1 Tax=Nucisporomicrobium flavum TaxID=2785915 RepID=UPI0018F67EBA|nr:MEDS domain-containing protein [Nucisporomicrobium flavum]